MHEVESNINLIYTNKTSNSMGCPWTHEDSDNAPYVEGTSLYLEAASISRSRTINVSPEGTVIVVTSDGNGSWSVSSEVSHSIVS